MDAVAKIVVAALLLGGCGKARVDTAPRYAAAVEIVGAKGFELAPPPDCTDPYSYDDCGITGVRDECMHVIDRRGKRSAAP